MKSFFIYLSLLVMVQVPCRCLPTGHFTALSKALPIKPPVIVESVWQSDLGNGTYQNPILFADYSDPDVCSLGEDYYLTASSFQCTPGLPILHSRDLVNWRIIGHALRELLPMEEFSTPHHGKGVWAPVIRNHNGLFYIYWGDPDRGIFVVRAERPEGPWSSPVCVVSGQGMIDPCPLWDDDGRCYLVNAWAASRADFNSVLSVRELSADGTQAIGLPHIVFDGGQVNHTTEGPKWYKHDGYYWIFCPAGGVATGWQLAMRSHSVYGPYTWRRVMDQGSTDVNGPHQGAWVHTEAGEDWFLHFTDQDAYGRVVWLQPMTWKNGWPVIGIDPDGDGCGEPVKRFRKPTIRNNPQVETESIDNQISPNPEEWTTSPWQWQANYQQIFGQPVTDGRFRLYAADRPTTNLWAQPALRLHKLVAPNFSATAKICFSAKSKGERAGLLVFGTDYAALVAVRTPKGFDLQEVRCMDAEHGQREIARTISHLAATRQDTIPYSPATHLELTFRLSIKDGYATFSYSVDGQQFKQATNTPFHLKKGKWVGAKMGIFVDRPQPGKARGWVDVQSWTLSKD